LTSVNMWKNLFSGNAVKKTDKRLNTLKGCVDALHRILTDPGTTHFNLVAVPEWMALREEVRAFNYYTEHNVVPRNIIMNKVQPPNPDCPFCTEIRKQHEVYLSKMDSQFSKYDVGIPRIMLYPNEISGDPFLLDIGSKLMKQIHNIDVKKAYHVQSADDIAHVYTQLPYIAPENLRFSTKGDVLYMTVTYGLHEDVVNALSFKRFAREIGEVKADNLNGKLYLQVRKKA